MTTYTVLYALDVPHYGTAEIEANDHNLALRLAREHWDAVQRGEACNPASDPDWDGTTCHRIVEITASNGDVVANDIGLDDCYLRYGGARERRLSDAASQLLAAACTALDALLPNHGDALAGRPHAPALDTAYRELEAAVAAASVGGQP